VQTVHWEEGNYQNLGPARLPSTHWTMLGYVRELGVPLEVEINTTRSSLLQNDKANGGKPVIQRKAINDTRGHVSELLSKCIRQGALDQDFSAGGPGTHAWIFLPFTGRWIRAAPMWGRNGRG
jgi:monoamine oxidase